MTSPLPLRLTRMSTLRGRFRPAPRDSVGSLARDHLANERTFLSWIRTALAFTGLGVLVAELVEREGFRAQVFGLVLIGLGAIAIVLAIVRYIRVTDLLESGKFAPTILGPLTAGLVTLLIAAGAMIFVLL